MPRFALDNLVVDHEDSVRGKFLINFSWFLKLRWAAVAGQLATIVAVAFPFGIELPLPELFAIITLEALSNVVFLVWFRWQVSMGTWTRWAHNGEKIIGGIMALDIVILSALLFVTGGATNPFSLFYLANISLAAVMLPPRFVWGLSGLSFACYLVLLLWHQPLEAMRALEEAAATSDERMHAAQLLLRGMLAAFGTAAIIVVYFVSRVTTVLAQREHELAVARHKRAQSERLEALATLAGGAAHELASPLSTIAVVAKELERELEQGAPREDAVEDTRLVRKEVARCREILDRMSADAGEHVGEELVDITVRELVRETLEDMPEDSVALLSVAGLEEDLHLYVPRHAMQQTVRGLIQNGLDASPPGEGVTVETKLEGDTILISVHDTGSGMPPEVLARCYDPFFTTKESGKGMGLGLFLARTVVERLGGRLDITSRSGAGTTATIRLPAGRNTVTA